MTWTSETRHGCRCATEGGTIKDAINYVSTSAAPWAPPRTVWTTPSTTCPSCRRNIQDAESTIRDTDVADEMMAYYQEQHLIQSAQAMLAQANQVPQGVLQLLQ